MSGSTPTPAAPARPATAFRGPLFLVGMPRSGTKLLRTLLNRSPYVGIPEVETEFLPFLAARWDRWGDLRDPARFSAFYAEVTRLPYFLTTREYTGRIIAERDWYAASGGFSVAEVFEALLRHDTDTPPGSDRVWGDKSPSYIGHIPLIRRLYPGARFIHIVRDVRDHVLSMKKAWNKHPIRAAQRWVDGVEAARRDAAAIPGAYVELRYEDLIAEPEPLLRRCCALLEIPFDPAMLDPGRVTENLGDAVGVRGLKRDNAGKWRERMDPALLARVEAIAGPVLRSLGYPVQHAGPAQRVPDWELRLYQAWDAVGLIRGEVEARGLVEAIRFRIDTWRVSGNRN